MALVASAVSCVSTAKTSSGVLAEYAVLDCGEATQEENAAPVTHLE
jgi:hypothetical protein